MPHQIETVEDLVRILKEHPEWRERVREVLLSDEERAVPTTLKETGAVLERLIELHERALERLARIEATAERLASFDQQLVESHEALRQSQEQLIASHEVLSQKQEQLTASHEALRQSQEQLIASHEALNLSHIRLSESHEALTRSHQAAIERLDRIESTLQSLLQWADQARVDIADSKGFSFETKMSSQAAARLGRFLRKPRRLEIAEFLDEMEEQGAPLTPEELEQLRSLDILVTGRDRRTGNTVYITVEVSWMLYPSDVERAEERAGLLRRCGYEAYPALIGRGITPEASTLAQQRRVITYLDGSLLHPGAFNGL